MTGNPRNAPRRNSSLEECLPGGAPPGGAPPGGAPPGGTVAISAPGGVLLVYMDMDKALASAATRPGVVTIVLARA